ncbi:MAG: hypothetical protein JO345_28865 [Streptosporangiaceae bacterium]|nr:hypothetical protein [Streptosporangiaceae bacterium]
MLLDRAFGHPEFLRDPAVGAPLRHQRQHLTFPGRQHVERVVQAAGRDEFGDESGIDDRAAPHQALERPDEIVDVDDPALEQVAASLATGQEVHRMLDLHVRGQDEDGDAGEIQADLASRVETLGGMAGRHPDVHDHQFGPLITDKREQLRGIPALPDDLEPRAVQQARETLAQQDVIVSQRDPDGDLGHAYDYRPYPVVMGALTAAR